MVTMYTWTLHSSPTKVCARDIFWASTIERDILTSTNSLVHNIVQGKSTKRARIRTELYRVPIQSWWGCSPQLLPKSKRKIPNPRSREPLTYSRCKTTRSYHSLKRTIYSRSRRYFPSRWGGSRSCKINCWILLCLMGSVRSQSTYSRTSLCNHLLIQGKTIQKYWIPMPRS